MSDQPVAPDRATSAPAGAPKPPSVIQATWVGAHRFDTSRPGGVTMRLDGSAESGQSPPDALLSSLAACSGIDVVDILAKRRTPVEALSIEVLGHRRAEPPRRFEHLSIVFDIKGAGIERVHAERAVQLAFDKYCSVAATLAPDLRVETVVVVNGERGAAIALGRAE